MAKVFSIKFTKRKLEFILNDPDNLPFFSFLIKRAKMSALLKRVRFSCGF
jgi:hypothetical protein